MTNAASSSFPVRPGRAYEMRALLVCVDKDSDRLVLATPRLQFFDVSGTWLDPQIAGQKFQVPYTDPVVLEALPSHPDSDVVYDAGLTSRYLVAPPDAVEMRVAFDSAELEVLTLEVMPIGIDWAAEGRRVEKEVAETSRIRREILERHFSASASDDRLPDILRQVENIPLAQFKAICAQFEAIGDWNPLLASLDPAEEARDFEERVTRCRQERDGSLRIAFIGSARSYARLRCLADVFLLREADWPAQLLGLAPDFIMIETVAETLLGDWRFAFCSLAGTMPEAGRTLCTRARERGIPIRLHVTADRREIHVWQEMLATADTVIVEGDPVDWPDLPVSADFVHPATEPAATPYLRTGRAEGTMLVPVASDIFQFPDFAEIFRQPSCYATLFTEFHYGFVARSLADRMTPAIHPMTALESQNQRTQLLQESTIVLLNGMSLRSHGEMREIILDAIVAGAIPVLFGPTALEGGVMDQLDRVWNRCDLQERQRLYRIPWLRERRWRALFRAVCRAHVWTGEDRRKLLGADHCPDWFDAPLISAVMISKRPHLLPACLETFRKQSWGRKELVLVLNADDPPAELPSLEANERLFAVPESWSIGRCLNIAIAEADGQYWAKMDDDDFYSANYLEELCHYYRATQADVVGRQSTHFFFAAEEKTYSRETALQGRCFREVADHEYIAGATLSAVNQEKIPSFSNVLRNGADTIWVEAIRSECSRIICYDSTSIVVYRDEDARIHTWSMQRGSVNLKNFAPHSKGNSHYMLETT